MARRYAMDIADARILGTGFSTNNWTWEAIETWMEENGIPVDGITARGIFAGWETQEGNG